MLWVFSFRNESNPFIKVILLGIGYALFIEIYQVILPWRSFGFDDIFWDSAGVMSVAIMYRLKIMIG